jgi:hypothetical protein
MLYGIMPPEEKREKARLKTADGPESFRRMSRRSRTGEKGIKAVY